jgi:putative PIN family toxin of toxin-antitoxin system
VRAVFDTNVLLAAFLTEGVCAKLLGRARRRQFELILSPFILSEFKRVLSRKFGADRAEIASALSLVAEAASAMVDPKAPFPAVCRDKDDDQVLACVRDAGAAFLVTGDADLLVLGKSAGALIITPRDFEREMEG